MKTFTKAFAALGVAAGAIISSTSAQAQQVNVNADLTVVRPLQLFVDRDLHFGRFRPSNGDVTIDPVTGTLSTNGVLPLNPDPAYPVGPAIVRAVGEPDTALSITLLQQAHSLDNISGGGDSLQFDVSDDIPVGPRLDNPGGGADGTLIFHLGGTVSEFTTATLPGVYRGSVQVTAAYQ